ncbi:MAG: PQQ-binding-like beta-propeller repeat protein [Planctomycetes bacterium]|nr:PQQ-binding-like beta-propeller repeat protein [Planctomycetota bacterium]
MNFENDLAVVPIFVNAGAAILPALAAGFATFFSLLFKPKELLALCKEKPAIPALICVLGLTVYGIFHFWPTPDTPQTSGRRRGSGPMANSTQAGTVQIDWTRIALERIKSKQRQKALASQSPSLSSQEEALTGNAPTNHSKSDNKEAVIYRGGPSRIGAIGAAPAGKLSLAWDYYPSWVDDDGSIEIEDSAMILSSPIAYGQKVFAASCVLDPPDSYGIVFCVDGLTGETIWSVDQVNGEEIKGFFSSPAVTADGKHLIIGQGLHPDKNCRLICIEVETGKVHWTVLTPLHLESSPAIDKGVVYIGAGAIEDPVTHKPTSHTGYVMAVRISDGKTLWQYDVADPESSPLVKDGVLYIGSGFNGQAIVALRTETDEELSQAGLERTLWKTPAPYPITGAVTMIGDTVFVGGGNGDFVFRAPKPAGIVMALDAKTGKIKWQKDMPDAVLGAVAADKYLICPVAAGKVIALNLETGNEVWATSISGKAPVLAGTAVVDGFIYAVSHDGYMAKLSADSGALIEKIYINSKGSPGEQGLSISSPMVVNGRIYVGSETGGLRSYVGEALQ